jgi:formylglycine-generating enzyme required for sulfatase activity
MAIPLALHGPATLALPGLLLAALATTIALQTGIVNLSALGGHSASLAPDTTLIAPRPYSYRAPGDFLRGTAAVDGTLVTVDDPAPLEIMTYQVSAAEYARCVADGACAKAEPRRRSEGNVPATGVSFLDATAYAAWLSAKTGETWRLPSVAEWAFAAGTRATDPALQVDNANNPADRWLVAYQREAELGDGGNAAPSIRGTFGINELGLVDIAGTVWEWTTTCNSRTTLGPTGEALHHVESCGVKVLEGRHRTLMSDFVRDAKSGGCSTGTPPDNLGFRLVRDPGPLGAMLRWIGLR